MQEPECYWSATRVAQFFDVGPRALYNWVRDGRLPPPVLLPNGRKGWQASMVRSLVKPGDSAAA
jgi:hypothetical protein